MQDIKLDFKDVMIVPKHGRVIDYAEGFSSPYGNLNSRKEVCLERVFTFPYGTVKARPIINANMDTIATLDMARILLENSCFVTLHKYYTIEELEKFSLLMNTNRIWPTFGLEKNFDKIDRVAKICSNLHFDVANGYIPAFIELIKAVRAKYPEHAIMAGTICTYDGFKALADAGANVVRAGIGSGSVCTTRALTGVGYPQWSCIKDIKTIVRTLFTEQRDEARLHYKEMTNLPSCGYIDDEHMEQEVNWLMEMRQELDDKLEKIDLEEKNASAYLVSDGGCVVPGDIAKALGAGADMVMLGGMLAGHDECAGEVCKEDGRTFEKPHEHYYHEGKLFKKYYGMASFAANCIHNGGLAEHRAAEGKEVMVPYRGPVQGTLNEIFGGLRSTCTYTGVKNIEDLKDVEFIKVNKQLNDVFGE